MVCSISKIWQFSAYLVLFGSVLHDFQRECNENFQREWWLCHVYHWHFSPTRLNHSGKTRKVARATFLRASSKKNVRELCILWLLWFFLNYAVDENWSAETKQCQWTKLNKAVKTKNAIQNFTREKAEEPREWEGYSRKRWEMHANPSTYII